MASRAAGRTATAAASAATTAAVGTSSASSSSRLVSITGAAKALSRAAASAVPSPMPSSTRSLSSSLRSALRPSSRNATPGSTSHPRPPPTAALQQLLHARSRSPHHYSTVTPEAPIPSSSLLHVTTLANGVRVATEATPGHFSAVGVYVDAGSRYERPWVPGESGASHLLDRMAFKSTSNRSTEQMTAEIEALGGNVMCSSSRETIMYQSSMFNQHLPQVLSIMADTINNPLLTDEELDAQREAAAWEIQEIWNKPEMILPEMLHTLAYRDNTLGNPLLCPLESLQQMRAQNLRDFMRAWYTPERIVVAGAGMPHQQLVGLSQELFGGLSSPVYATAGSDLASSATSGTSSPSSSVSRSASPASRHSSVGGASSPATSYGSFSADFSTSSAVKASHVGAHAAALRPEVASQRARYTGGELYDSRPDLEFLHIYVAFEGLSIHDPDIYALATLQILLGGGGSFSAGGPGKGMYSRLYTNVLNQYHAVDYCAAFHHCYADSGLFGIAASVVPSFGGSMASIIARELELCTGDGLGGGVGASSSSSLRRAGGAITASELSRAKNQLKSSLVMALESRLVEVEDLGRQVQVHGKKVSVEEMCERIDEVDVEKLQRVARRVLRPERRRGGVGVSMSPSPSPTRPLNFGLGSGEATVVVQGNLESLGDVRQLLASRGLGAPPTSAA